MKNLRLYYFSIYKILYQNRLINYEVHLDTPLYVYYHLECLYASHSIIFHLLAKILLVLYNCSCFQYCDNNIGLLSLLQQREQRECIKYYFVFWVYQYYFPRLCISKCIYSNSFSTKIPYLINVLSVKYIICICYFISIYLSIYQSIYLTNYLYLSIYLSIHLFIYV